MTLSGLHLLWTYQCTFECDHDACHFCYEARRALRARFPQVLTPDQMYGVMEKTRDSGDHE